MSSERIPPTIVVVEDNYIGQFLRMLLQREGFQVITANASEGAGILRACESRVSLLITNTPTKFAEFGERVPLLYLAAFPDPALTRGFRCHRALSKPFAPEVLMECVRSLLAAPVPLPM